MVLQAVNKICSGMPSHDKEDIMQDVMLSIVEGIPETIDNPRAYIYGITLNMFRKFMRDKYQKNSVNLEFEPLDEYDDDERPGLMLLLQSDCLTGKERQALELRADGKYPTEISEIMGTSVDVIYNLHSQGIKKLREKCEIFD